MEYISTRNNKKTFSFKDVFLKGLAPDGGLFVPRSINSYSFQELNNLKNLSYKKLAEEIIFKFSHEEFSKNEIKDLINISYENCEISSNVHLSRSIIANGSKIEANNEEHDTYQLLLGESSQLKIYVKMFTSLSQQVILNTLFISLEIKKL